MTPDVFRLRLVIYFELRDSCTKASRRLGERTSESRARGHTTSHDGTFNICPYTNFKPTVSAFQNSKLELDRMDSPLAVRL